MANKSLFKSIIGKMLPSADTLNKEWAIAYDMPPKQKLAQYVATGCLNSTFYADAEEQLSTVIQLCESIEPEFIAKAAVYARRFGYMKDMPALLCAVLSKKDIGLLTEAFPLVCDNGRMLRTFVQIVRSGAAGRKSFGSKPKKLIRNWLYTRSDNEVFLSSIGQNPSIADIIKMVHPLPGDGTREALYGYLIGRSHNQEALPDLVRNYELYKAGEIDEIPDVPFQMLTSLPLIRSEWVQIAKNARWHTMRMNLNTFARHGVFEEKGMAELMAERLKNPEAIRRSRVFPYQLMVAYFMTGSGVPLIVKNALQDAMEIATENIPVLKGKLYICPDVSGSMRSPMTGFRKGSTSVVQCTDAAALITASFMRKNPDAEVLPFENGVVRVNLNPRDSVMTNAAKLASVGGGGTNCSAPLRILNKNKAEGDMVLLISDNQSWVDDRIVGATALMREWNKFKERNPRARLVCLDLQPYGTVQAAEREDILNLGGFSDQIFNLVPTFAEGKLRTDHWVGEIEAVKLDA